MSRTHGDILAEDAQLRAIAREGHARDAMPRSIAGLDRRDQLAIHAYQLATAAADRRRPRKAPLTRREALREAPWVPEMLEQGVDEHYWRARYADRLVERGLALPSSAGRSGPSGRTVLPSVLITSVSPEQRATWDAAARRAGLDRSTWIRRELDAASTNDETPDAG